MEGGLDCRDSRKTSGLLALGNPWGWVLIAALLRLGILAILPWGFINPALERTPGALKGTPAESRRPIDFLQRRVQLRPLTEDEHRYDEMARNLVAGRGFVLDSVWLVTTPGQPAMYAGCMYPLFVAAIYCMFGSGDQLPVFVVQILLHALAAYAIFLAATKVAGPRAGAAAAGFFSFHPTVIWSSLAMMSEAVAVPLVAVLAWLLIDRRAWGPWRTCGIGVILACLCLTRSVFGLFVWVVAAWLLWESRGARPWRRRAAHPLVFLLAFVAVCAPWTWRNYVHWNRFIPFSTKSGATAWMHNHPGLKVEFGPAAVFGPQPIDIFDPKIQDLPDEAARDATLMAMFRDFVRRNPAKFLGLVWMRFWMAVLPVTVTSKAWSAVASAWYSKGAVIALLAIGVWTARPRLALRVLPWTLFAAYWLALQSMAGSGMRYRLPAEPVWSCIVGVLGAVALAALWPRLGETPLARRWLRDSSGTPRSWGRLRRKAKA